MRTFIALELSEEIKEELGRLQDELKAADAEVKWVKPQNIHLTLKFIGNAEESKIEEIKKILESISSQNHPFEISLFRPGAFPELNRPRVIWVGIDKGCAEVEKIAKIVSDELEKTGFPKEERPFSAHLTLGRVKSGRNKARLKEKILSLETRPTSSAINHITFFRSTLTPSGAIYTALCKAKFKN